jgi:hypothetical protein
LIAEVPEAGTGKTLLAVLVLLASAMILPTARAAPSAIIQTLPYLFETWLFGDAFVCPAWYPLILTALAIIGLRFGESSPALARIVPASALEVDFFRQLHEDVKESAARPD